MMLMLGCLLGTYGVITLIFGYPSKEARRRRQRLSEVLEDLERTGGTSAVAVGGKIA